MHIAQLGFDKVLKQGNYEMNISDAKKPLCSYALRKIRFS